MNCNLIKSTRLTTQSHSSAYVSEFYQTRGILQAEMPIFGPMKALQGHAWQTGLCGSCGLARDQANVVVRYLKDNEESCSAMLKIRTEPPHWTRYTQWIHFYPGKEVHINLSDMVEVPTDICLMTEISAKVVCTHPIVWSLIGWGGRIQHFLQSDSILFDCQIEWDGTHFQVHRFVLAAHSPILRRTLLSNEKIDTLDGIPAVAFGLFLTYLYHGYVTPDDLKEHLCSLLELAAVYQVHNLLEYLMNQLPEVFSANRKDVNDIVSLVQHYWDCERSSQPLESSVAVEDSSMTLDSHLREYLALCIDDSVFG